ncbi:MAG: nuclear transport factor 2 family protein [Cyclobacteriaceae bacterium]
MNSPIPKWHHAVDNMDKSILDEILDKNCVFYSPILFKPQEGKTLTKMYLTAAFHVFQEAGNFHYIKTVEQGNNAVLEFNATIDGIVIDGVDIITWNDRGIITEFKVMLRPFRAIEKLGEKMKTQISKMSTMDKASLKLNVFKEKYLG